MSEVTPDAFIKALRAEGLVVHTFRKNWRTHNRNFIARPNRHGIANHHTGPGNSKALIALCWNGRSDLPGPLCESVMPKNGEVWMVGYGRTNNFGKGDADTMSAMIKESGNLPPRASLTDDIDFNSSVHALEIINAGDGKDPYPIVQKEAIVKWNTAACRVHGWTEDSIIGHREGTKRKIDPTLSMDWLRSMVHKALALPPGQWHLQETDPTPPSGIDPKKKLAESLDAIEIGLRDARSWLSKIK